MTFASAHAQSDREAVLRRVIDGLNSADPIKRMITLEEAMTTNDGVIRAIATKTAMASSDVTLRSLALAEVFKTKSTLILKLTGFKDDGENDHGHLMDHTPGTLDLVIRDFDAASGDFKVYSSFSRNTFNEKRQEVPDALPANLAGDRVSFTLNVGEVYSVPPDSICRGTAHLKDGTPILSGTMNCARYGNYDIEIELLR